MLIPPQFSTCQHTHLYHLYPSIPTIYYHIHYLHLFTIYSIMYIYIYIHTVHILVCISIRPIHPSVHTGPIHTGLNHYPGPHTPGAPRRISKTSRSTEPRCQGHRASRGHGVQWKSPDRSNHWIGFLGKSSPETMVFTIKYMLFRLSCNFSLQPIHWSRPSHHWLWTKLFIPVIWHSLTIQIVMFHSYVKLAGGNCCWLILSHANQFHRSGDKLIVMDSDRARSKLIRNWCSLINWMTLV